MDHLRAASPPCSLAQTGLGWSQDLLPATYLKFHPSRPCLPASHQGKGEGKGPSSTFCLPILTLCKLSSPG